MSSIPSLEEMRANLPTQGSVINVPPKDEKINSHLETYVISSVKQSFSSNEGVELKKMKSSKSNNNESSINDSLVKNILQDIKQLQYKVESIESEIFKKKKPDFRKEIKVEILNILKTEPELMGWNSANTKRLENRILKLENELQDMMTLVLELCDSFPKGDSESVLQCESKQLHKLVKLELDNLTKEVLDSNKQTLKSFNKGEVKQLRADLKAERKRNNVIESRLKILENGNKSKQSISKGKVKETEPNNINTKSDSSTNLKTKGVKFQTESQISAKKDRKISHDEKNSSSTVGPVSTVTNTKKKTTKSNTGSKNEDNVTTENKIEEGTRNKHNEMKKGQIYVLSESENSKKTSTPETSKFIMSNEMINDPVLSEAPLVWAIRKHFKTETATKNIQHGRVFFSDTPGYRLQFRAEIDRLHGDIYFSVRVMKGIFDDQISWPCNEKFHICILDTKGRPDPDNQWILPDTDTSWNRPLRKVANKGDQVHSEWIGPFNISHFITKNVFKLQVSLA